MARISIAGLRRSLLAVPCAVALTLAATAASAFAREDATRTEPHAAVRVDTTFIMSDGVTISATYTIPGTPAPPGGFPALLLVHGFGGSKRDAPGAFAPRYADSGYFCLAYSVRGQGRGDAATQSGGTFNWFTGDRELQDTRTLIDWLRSRADVNRERIGAEGISQGALTAWGAAVHGMPVRCIVTIIAVPHYSNAFTFNGCNSWALMLLLYAAKTLDKVAMGPFIGDTVYNGLLNDNHAETVRLLEGRDLMDRIATLDVPAYIQCAWHDELVNPRDALRAFEALRGPRKLMLYPGGHALPADGATAETRMLQTLRFYRRWLKDDAAETVMRPDSAIALVDNGTHAMRWIGTDALGRYTAPELPGTATNIRLFLTSGDRLIASEPTDHMEIYRNYIKDISNDALAFRSAPMQGEIRITGARCRLVVGSSASKFQANVSLFDVDTAAGTVTPICRGAYEVRVPAGQTRARGPIEYDLAPQLYTLRAGHRVLATVKFGMPGGSLALQRPEGEFGQSAYAPAESGTDGLYSTPAAESDYGPSFITLFLADSPNMGAPEPHAERTDGHLEGSPALNGEPVSLHMAGVRGTGRARVVDLRGAVMVSMETIDGHATIATANLPSGPYFVTYTDDRGTWRGSFLVVR